MDSSTLFFIIQILSLALVAWGFGSFVEGWAIHRYSYPEGARLYSEGGKAVDGFIVVSWERAFFVAGVANGVAILFLGTLHFLLENKFMYLGFINFGKFDIFFNWMIATMIANAIELSIVKWVFRIPVTRMVAFITSLSNGLCALAELYVGLGEKTSF